MIRRLGEKSVMTGAITTWWKREDRYMYMDTSGSTPVNIIPSVAIAKPGERDVDVKG